MRFKSCRKVMPELVAAKDESRPILTRVHLNVEQSVVEVTDSYMLARFPVELDEGDTSGQIPVEALKASRKPPLRNLPTSIRANSHAEVRMGFGEDASEPYITLPRETGEYTFPDTLRLVPEDLSGFEIGLNAELLHKLAKAMGDDAVRISFAAEKDGSGPSNLRPMLVRPASLRPGAGGTSEDDPVGVLMPIRIP